MLKFLVIVSSHVFTDKSKHTTEMNHVHIQYQVTWTFHLFSSPKTTLFKSK